MKRIEFLGALAAASSAAPARSDVSAQIEIRRDASELLAPFSVAIVVRNSAAHIVALNFATADMYRIDVTRDGQTIWSTATGHKPLLIARRVEIAPGVTRLASQIVDGTTDDRRSYAPGNYGVHVAMLAIDLSTSIDRTIDFPPPISIADARTTNGGRVVTIAGIARSDAGVTLLRDASGSLQLSRPLGLRPTGTYVVRGFIDAVENTVQFAVGRFAPAFDNHTDARPRANASNE